MIPKILATVPVYTAVTPEPYISHLIFSQETGKAEILGKYKVRWNAGGPGVRTPIVRNGGAQIALQGGADHLLFVDDDMILPPTIIESLLAMDVPIASPIFFRAGEPYDPLVFDMDRITKEPVSMWDYPVDQIFEAPGGVGTGVMLIKTEVFRSLPYPWFFYPQDHRWGMDLDFCRRAREAGFKAYCDSRILVEQMERPKKCGRKQWEERKKRDER
jgi:GT2 family glycosyltransferase